MENAVRNAGLKLGAYKYEDVFTAPYNADWRVKNRSTVTIPQREMCRFLEEMVSAVRSGITISEFINQQYGYVCGEIKGPGKRNRILDGKGFNGWVIAELYDMLNNQGFGLAESLGQFKRIFGRDTIRVIEAAEQSGTYTGNYNAMTGEYEESLIEQHIRYKKLLAELKNDFAQKLIMPAFTLIVLLAVVALFVVRVIPSLSEMIIANGGAINPFTQSVIVLANILSNYWLPLLLTAAAAVGGYIFLRRNNQTFREIESEILMRIPVLNRYLAQLSAYQWLGAYSVMRAVGEARNAVFLAAESVAFQRFRKNFKTAADELDRGTYSNIADAIAAVESCLHEKTSFYRTLKNYGATGQTALLNAYRKELELRLRDTLQRLARLAEPTITVILGLAVGYVVVSFYLPLIQIIASLVK